MEYLLGFQGIERLVELHRQGRVVVLLPRIEVFLYPPARMQVHKVQEVVTSAIDEVVAKGISSPEELPMLALKQIHKSLLEIERARVEMRAEYIVFRHTPITKQETQEMYQILARAMLEDGKITPMLGAEVTGITACPCAHEGLVEKTREKLKREFSDAEIERIFSSVPVASHNQRNISTLMLSVAERGQIDVDGLIDILERSMSSRLYEVLKREDEVEVVYRAHLNPNFVEDTVRKILVNTLERFPHLSDDTLVYAKSESLESIHQHNALAERFTTLGELRREVGDYL
ncbi:GTP cyclohydrolase MptA [Candidatus Pyrohabitans sp.]